MAREYGVDNGDGTVTVWGTDDQGNFWPIRTESMATNQGQVTQGRTGGGSWNTGGYGGGMNIGGGSAYLPYELQAATDAAQQQYLRDRLNQLDIPMSEFERNQIISQLTGYYMPGGITPGMGNDQALDYIIGTRDQKFWDFYKANGWKVGTNEEKRKAVQNWIDSANPEWKGMSPVQVAQKLGANVQGAFAGGYSGQEGALPTFTREQWNEANRQWQNQFDTGREQYALSTLASKSGPMDYWVQQQMMPKGAFGEVQPSNNSWEQLFLNYWNKGRQAGAGALPGQAGAPGAQIQPVGEPQVAGFQSDQSRTGTESTTRPYTVPFNQPKDITPQQWNKLGPSGQQMQAGAWSYWGQNPQDMAKQMQAAWPTGQAAQNTYWR